MSLVTFHDVSLILASHVLLDQVNWQIQPNARIALVGRNGAGKSTLLKVLQGNIIPDKGHIHRQQGLRVAGLAQEVPFSGQDTVYQCLVRELGELGEVLCILHQDNVDEDAWMAAQHRLDELQGWSCAPEIDAMVSHLGLDPLARMENLSGGMKRRVLLASALLAKPDLVLLDEPTNHLDIQSIEWLETYLKTYPGSVVVVTHDREFLARVATQIVEIDRGRLQSYACDYDTYLERRDAMRAAEETQNNLFDKRLSEEEIWLRTGVKARRTRNEGRVRALKAMRDEYQKRRVQQGQVKKVAVDVKRSGTDVIYADQVNYVLNNKDLIRDFSCLLTRGDKVGIIGPNGCGKTTLVRLLLQEIIPTTGTVIQGTSLEVAYFDQLRAQLDETKTVMENVADGADYVTIQGKQKHVASYLQDFLFSKERLNQPISVLSGGERNRLLLAKLFARSVNFLVMDEPTNDLDIETLELLESLLVDYTGTLLLISHDRAFINHVVTHIWIYEGDGKFNDYVGGYDTYLERKQSQVVPVVKKTIAKPAKISTSLTTSEQRELAKLPQQIQSLEKKQAELEAQMAEMSFYQLPAETQQKLTVDYNKGSERLAALYHRWEELECLK